ncbi:MAG: hypothetical protein H6633_22590 [Anaerolineales bacterium]|nr:hypothetical protein [Anaerolineales bacterium]
MVRRTVGTVRRRSERFGGGRNGSADGRNGSAAVGMVRRMVGSGSAVVGMVRRRSEWFGGW